MNGNGSSFIFLLQGLLLVGLCIFTFIRIFVHERRRIIFWIVCLGIIDAGLGYFIYCILSKVLYPAYQKISQIPEVKLSIFFLSCYIIIEIILFNRDEEYSTSQADTLFSGFGLGNGLSWFNQNFLNLIAIIRGLNSTVVSYVLNNNLEDNCREPLRKALLAVLEQNNVVTDVFIDALRDRIKRGNNSPIEDKLNRIIEKYKDTDQELFADSRMKCNT